MATKRLIDQLRELVDEETRDTPTVSNLHGIVESPEVGNLPAQPQHWWFGLTPGTSLPDYNSLFAGYTYQKPGVEPVDASNGTATYPASGAGIPAGNVGFFFGLARIRSRNRVAISARGEGASIAVFIGGNQVAVGADNLSVAQELTRGDHQIVVMYAGAQKPVSVTVSRQVEIVRTEVTPPAPVWVDFPEAELIDPLLGKLVVHMGWNNGSDASAWNIYRAETEIVGEFSQTAPAVDVATGQVTFVVTSVVTVPVGEMLYSPYSELGRVVRVIPAAGVTLADYSAITVIPSLLADPDVTAWPFGGLVLRGKDYKSLATIPNPGKPVIEYVDTAIVTDRMYLYKITGLSALGTIETEYSKPVWVWTNDDMPPESIDTDPEHPPLISVTGSDVTVRFTSPPDLDYKGVYVYGPFPLDETGEAIAIDLNMLNFSGSTPIASKLGTGPLTADSITFNAGGTGDVGFYIATFDILGNIQPTQDVVIRRNGSTAMGAFQFIYAGPNSGAPSLTVVVTPGDAIYTIEYSGSGTITASINGGSFTTPSASPWEVSRTSEQIIITLRSEVDGQQVVQIVVIPPIEFQAGTVSLTYAYSPIYGRYLATVGFTSTGPYSYFHVQRYTNWYGADYSIGETYLVNGVQEPKNLLTFTPWVYLIDPNSIYTFELAIVVVFYDGTDNYLGETPLIVFTLPGEAAN